MDRCAAIPSSKFKKIGFLQKIQQQIGCIQWKFYRPIANHEWPQNKS